MKDVSTNVDDEMLVEQYHSLILHFSLYCLLLHLGNSIVLHFCCFVYQGIFNRIALYVYIYFRHIYHWVSTLASESSLRGVTSSIFEGIFYVLYLSTFLNRSLWNVLQTRFDDLIICIPDFFYIFLCFVFEDIF